MIPEDIEDTERMEREKREHREACPGRRLVIKCPGGIVGTTVEIDGVPVHGITEIGFRHDAGDVPRVTLTLLPRTVEIEGNAEVERTTICPACKVRQKEKADAYTALEPE